MRILRFVPLVVGLASALPSSAEGEFKSIFDGESLDGWKCRPESQSENWKVEGGRIIGTGKGQESYLMFNEQLGDFELKFSYRLLTKGNTGLEVRSRPVPGRASRLHGYHADIGHVGIGDKVLGAWDFHEDNRGDYLAKRAERVTIDQEGKMKREKIAGALALADVKKGDWNEVVVFAKGNHLWFTINGKVASEVVDNEVSKRLDRGFIGFQLHGGDKMVVEFKDISVKVLDAAGGGGAPPGADFGLREGDVVAFMGGTDLVNLQKEGRLEAALTTRWRAATPRFRDFAWDGDTVYFQSAERERWRKEAFGSWEDQLKRANATVVVAQFGKMESLEGEERVGEFIKAYEALLDKVSAQRRVVILEPCAFQWEGASERAALEAYRVAIGNMAKRRGVPFVQVDGGDPAGSLIEGLTGQPEPEGRPYELMVATVHEKHRLWCEYWRPANWKCIFGDDSKRIFSKAAHGRPSIQEEWATYPALIAEVERAIFAGEEWVPPAPPELKGSREANVEKELASFELLEGFEVNLFADQSHGVRNPLSVRWDAQGRMYVACSDVYPQVEPGVRGYDRVILLEDKDADGRADESRVFADGLMIPTGMEVGPDCVYIGQGPELLTLKDTTGDGVADERKVLLTGFGNGDSHQTSNCFVWSPGGELWWCQGDGIESRVETPHGVSSLFQAGVYRLRPQELRLDPLLDDFMGPGNPWGIAFDDFGQSFVIDGAGGVSYLTPGSIPAKRRLRLPRIGNPGGYCGIECLGASTLPDGMQGEFVIGDYKKNQVSRFATSEDGAGFKLEWKSPLIRSTHRNFRPIDVKMGPDGAIYVVDWYNPITCHQDDFYRHPERDKTHGRIWRISAKKGAIKPPNLASASIPSLVAELGSPERWNRLKAKQVLVGRPAKEVLQAVKDWVKSGLEGRDLLEAAALLEWMRQPDSDLLELALDAGDHRVRAYGARLAGRWSGQLENAHELLLQAARDAHPLVRMEAVLASAQVPEPRSVLVAAAAAESRRDRWIDYAFSQAVHHLKGHWLPVFRSGQLDFSDVRRGLAAVLSASGSKGVVDEIRELVRSGNLAPDARGALTLALVTVGGEDDLQAMLNADQVSPDLLLYLSERDRPDFDVVPALGRAVLNSDTAVSLAAIELAAAWKVKELYRSVFSRATDEDGSRRGREVATRALGALGSAESIASLKAMTVPSSDTRLAAVAALLDLSIEEAADSAVDLLRSLKDVPMAGRVLADFAGHAGGLQMLARKMAEGDLDAEQAERIRQAWVASGFVDNDLEAVLNKMTGVVSDRIPFAEARVGNYVEAGKTGDRERGKTLFHSSLAGCAACHRVGTKGGVIGPDLSAVGSGLLPDRIVTEVLWPRRQVKEGYALKRVVTRDGRVVQGYEQASRNEDVLLLRDFATSQLHEIRKDSVGKEEAIGSMMPPTAQGFSNEELADLFAYLFSLDGSGN